MKSGKIRIQNLEGQSEVYSVILAVYFQDVIKLKQWNIFWELVFISAVA